MCRAIIIPCLKSNNINSGRFDSENFQEADGNKAIYSIMRQFRIRFSMLKLTRIQVMLIKMYFY